MVKITLNISSHSSHRHHGRRAPGWLFSRCRRTQLMLTLAFDIAIHESQGNILLCSYLDIGSSDESDDQSFTAFSRCSTPQNMLRKPFSLERSGHDRTSKDVSTPSTTYRTWRALKSSRPWLAKAMACLPSKGLRGRRHNDGGLVVEGEA